MMGRALQRRVGAIKKKGKKAPRRDRRRSAAGSARKRRGAQRGKRQSRSNDGGCQVLGGSDFIWLTSSDRGRYLSPTLYPGSSQCRSSGNAATSRLSAAFSNGMQVYFAPDSSAICALAAATRSSFVFAWPARPQWEGLIAARLRADGWPEDSVAETASATLALIEGALLLARVSGHVSHLAHAKRASVSLLTVAPVPGGN
jgi:hypothetical protein